MLLRTALVSLCLGLLLGQASAQTKSGPRLAYEVYVGCYNQHLIWLETPGERDDLMPELDGCRQLARHVLHKSKTTESTRLVAHLLLLDTDAGESEQNNELLHSKRRFLKPHLLEVGKRLQLGKCVIEGVKLENPSPRLCADRYDVERRLNDWR
jgi:hypothetical protein